VRHNDGNRGWLAGRDKCIERDSTLSTSPVATPGVDWRILHLPVLWRKYHGQLAQKGEAFWIAMVREATMKRLEASCGEESHAGYKVEGAESGWYRELIDERMDSWNEDVCMDAYHGDDYIGGEEHWKLFRVL
jgi:hypothetical protein